MFGKILDFAKTAGGGDFLGGIGGGIVSGLFGSRQAKRQMSFQAGQTAQQMAFQERMARHAHQYEVEDLLAAGLNPILSGTGGAGAQAMPGASGSGAMSGLDPMTSALATKRLVQEIKNLKATEKNINASTSKIKEDEKKIEYGQLSQIFGTGTYDQFSKDVKTFEKTMLDLINSLGKSVSDFAQPASAQEIKRRRNIDINIAP